MWEWFWRWETLWMLLWLLYVPSCIVLIIVVLLQKGKGVGFAGAFGIGPGSDTVFGPRASKSLPVRLTYTVAALFMILALCMSLLSGRVGRGIAPEKVEVGTDMSGVDAALAFDELGDLGAAVPPDAGAAPADAGAVTVTPMPVPADAAAQTSNQPLNVVQTPQAITVNMPPEAQPPAEPPAETPPAAAPPAAEVTAPPSDAAAPAPEAAPSEPAATEPAETHTPPADAAKPAE